MVSGFVSAESLLVVVHIEDEGQHLVSLKWIVHLDQEGCTLLAKLAGKLLGSNVNIGHDRAIDGYAKIAQVIGIAGEST